MIVSIESMSVFIIASMLLALAPGPDNIFVLTQTFLHGRKAGFMITVGLCTGLLFHTGLVVLGVTAIFKTSLFAFTLLKLFGAGYLLYLAWLAFRSHQNELTSTDIKKPSIFSLYQRGIIMNVTNPKVGLFFLAYLPQFINTEKDFISMQMIILGGLFIISAFIVFGVIVILSHYIKASFFESPSKRKLVSLVSAVIFIALALNLLLAQQNF